MPTVTTKNAPKVITHIENVDGIYIATATANGKVIGSVAAVDDATARQRIKAMALRYSRNA